MKERCAPARRRQGTVAATVINRVAQFHLPDISPLGRGVVPGDAAPKSGRKRPDVMTDSFQARQPPGFASRRAAADLLEAVLHRRRPLDEQSDSAAAALRELPDRDRALARRIAATVLRRLGTLRRLIGSFLDRGLPRNAAPVECALLIGAAQLLFLDVPDHAAVDLSVRLVQRDPRQARYSGLVNAVLRRIARAGTGQLDKLDSLCLDTPEWLLARWTKTYGEETARAIARANGYEPPLDLSVKSDAAGWAERLNGRVMPTGTVRLTAHGAVSAMQGFADGSWWVQDAAAALPARFIGEVAGHTVADLCAAPGGKTAQLALAGAAVTAVDRSEPRMARLRQNLTRLGMVAATVVTPAEQWSAGPFDAVLVDAPCTSTGTIRRHPDVPWRRAPTDLEPLVAVQTRLLEHAVGLTRPGGVIVFCTCSLEPEEGEDIVAAALDRDPRLRRSPIGATEFGGLDGLLTPLGELRTLPCHWPDADPKLAGLDGFYAARLERI
jgi:16S rRNA (cytosine967-C5)-methyltransferase